MEGFRRLTSRSSKMVLRWGIWSLLVIALNTTNNLILQRVSSIGGSLDLEKDQYNPLIVQRFRGARSKASWFSGRSVDLEDVVNAKEFLLNAGGFGRVCYRLENWKLWSTDGRRLCKPARSPHSISSYQTCSLVPLLSVFLTDQLRIHGRNSWRLSRRHRATVLILICFKTGVFKSFSQEGFESLFWHWIGNDITFILLVQ